MLFGVQLPVFPDAGTAFFDVCFCSFVHKSASLIPASRASSIESYDPLKYASDSNIFIDGKRIFIFIDRA